MEKQHVLLVTDYPGLTASIARAFGWAGCVVDEIVDAGALKEAMAADEYAVVVILQSAYRQYSYWLWEVMRGEACNPVIFLGYENESFIFDEQPVCKHETRSHGYLRIPVRISELKKRVELARAISGEDHRESIKSRFSREWASLYDALHGFSGKSDLAVLHRISRFFDKHRDVSGCTNVRFVLEQMASQKWNQKTKDTIFLIKEGLIAYGKK